jgi:hypothetical protein
MSEWQSAEDILTAIEVLEEKNGGGRSNLRS